MKAENPGVVVLFLVDDFYEAFHGDAFLVAKELGLSVVEAVSAKRHQKLPMVGFPKNLLDGYLAKLVKAGHRVAICEEVK